MSLLLGSAATHSLPLLGRLTLLQALALLVLLMLLRGGLQGLLAVDQERLRSRFTDRLRQQLLN